MTASWLMEKPGVLPLSFYLTVVRWQKPAIIVILNSSGSAGAIFSPFFTAHSDASGKGAAHFVSFCNMAFSALFRIFLLLSLFIAFFVLNLEKSGKRSAKGCKSRKSHAPLSFCILFQCVKISLIVQNWTKKFAKVAKVTKGCKMRCIFPDV